MEEIMELRIVFMSDLSAHIDSMSPFIQKTCRIHNPDQKTSNDVLEFD